MSVCLFHTDGNVEHYRSCRLRPKARLDQFDKMLPQHIVRSGKQDRVVFFAPDEDKILEKSVEGTWRKKRGLFLGGFLREVK